MVIRVFSRIAVDLTTEGRKMVKSLKIRDIVVNKQSHFTRIDSTKTDKLITTNHILINNMHTITIITITIETNTLQEMIIMNTNSNL